MAESEKHKELKNKSIEYLFNKSYWIARMEVNCGYYGIYDSWGINSGLKTMGIEVKISRADFRNNKFKEATIDNSIKFSPDSIPANENYIFCPAEMLQVKDIHPKFGLLWLNENGRIVNKKKAEFIEMTDKTKLMILISFLSSRQNNVSL